jgi:hypothetical protein
MRLAGLAIPVIAEILARSEDEVERIIRRYVARAAAIKEALRPRCGVPCGSLQRADRVAANF